MFTNLSHRDRVSERDYSLATDFADFCLFFSWAVCWMKKGLQICRQARNWAPISTKLVSTGYTGQQIYHWVWIARMMVLSENVSQDLLLYILEDLYHIIMPHLIIVDYETRSLKELYVLLV